MKTKLFTLLTLALFFCSGAWAGDPTPGDANSTYLDITRYSTIDDAGINSGAYKMYGYSSNAGKGYLVVSAWEAYKSKGNQKWVTDTSEGNQNRTWSATGIFLGSDFYFKKAGSSDKTANAAKVNNSRAYSFKVTNCIEVHALVKTASSNTISLTAYPLEADLTTRKAAAGSDTDNSNSITTLSVTGLSTSVIYEIVVVTNNSANSEFYEIAFVTPEGPSITAQTIADASYVIGTAAGDVTALSVTATASAGDLSYQWYKNTAKSTTTPAPTAIDGATSSSYKPLTTADEEGDLYYFCKVTDSNGSAYSNIAKITVASASAPTISISGDASAARGADAITLTADVTGTPSPTIEWFQCDDALKTNPASQGDASTANTTFDVATTTVGTYYFYAVANNGVGGDGDHNVFSDVKTITIVPKAPTMPAAVKFTTSKTVTIAKADGEAVAATIKYKEGDGDWQDYSEALTLTATKTITAKVIQGGLESAEVSRTYTKVDLTEPTSISGAATWDWTTITNGSNIDFGDEGEGSLRNVDVLFCDISKFDYSAVTAPAAFNQTALIMNGQRPYANANSTKHCQVNSLKFTTTVAGKVSIEYANTGGNPARTVCVQVGSGDPQYGTHSSDGNVYSTNYVTDEFNVTAGTITIKGVLGSDHSEDKMLRIRKIVFTLPEPSTPTDDGAGHVTLTTTANMDGWRTFYPEKADQNYTADADVYYVSASNSTTVTLTKIDDGVPANTPVILHQTSGTTITLTETATDITAPGDNQLAVSTAGQNLGKVYRLGYKAANGVGFYTYTTTSAPAGIIYLATLGSANYLGLDFEDGETTGVASVGKPQTTTNREFYNLAGQRVAQPTKGLYIVNGKKVIVR